MRITILTDFNKLRNLSRTMQRAADIIENEASEELEDMATQLEAKARANALRILPRRGGLAAEVASSDFTRRRRKLGMLTVVDVSASGAYDLAGINEGTVIHPTYGHRPWVQQSVTAGWFTGPLDEIEDDLADNMDSLMRRAVSIIR